MIAYVDTSILVKLLIEDEAFRAESERLWLDSDDVVCAEIGYAEARAALEQRLTASSLRIAKDQLDLLWEQVSIVVVDTQLVHAAGDLAERDALRGYDAVHLAAAVAAEVELVATADRQLLEAALRRGFSIAGPA